MRAVCEMYSYVCIGAHLHSKALLSGALEGYFIDRNETCDILLIGLAGNLEIFLAALQMRSVI